MARDYGNLGIVHQRRGNLDEAEALQRKALDLHKELGNKRGMANHYSSLGNVHNAHGNLDEAEAVWLKALDLNEELGHKEGMANAYVNLGIVHDARGNLDEAEAVYRKALDLLEMLGSPKAESVREWLSALKAKTDARRERLKLAECDPKQTVEKYISQSRYVNNNF